MISIEIDLFWMTVENHLAYYIKRIYTVKKILQQEMLQLLQKRLFIAVLTSLMSAMGGNWLSNQLIKSENVATLSTLTAAASSVSGVIGTIKDKIVKLAD